MLFFLITVGDLEVKSVLLCLKVVSSVIMDTSSWRTRVLLEPRGFIRVLEFILAIVAFATTGGYSDNLIVTINCGNASVPDEHRYSLPVSYPFSLDATPVPIKFCNNDTTSNHQFNGDLSPSAEWFLFVGVTAFLYALASIVFYVIFDAGVRATHERLVTVGDLVGTVLYAFFWLTAASAWAWGLNEIKYWTDPDQVKSNFPLDIICADSATQVDRCGIVGIEFGPLNASVAFAFLNFFLWSCNVWFVYKESPYHQEPAKNEAPASPPNNM